ncbi:MAG: hypothetical protein AAB583_00270 [Patescibacteria group bacterium]
MMEQKEYDEYQSYLEKRKQSIITEQESARLFDKSILTLAAGALALSVTFIDKIAPSPKTYSICFLIISWILFCISLLSTLLSFLTTQEACRKQRDILDQNLLGKKVEHRISSDIWTNRLNYISIFCFIFGILFFLIFSALNLP